MQDIKVRKGDEELVSGYASGPARQCLSNQALPKQTRPDISQQPTSSQHSSKLLLLSGRHPYKQGMAASSMSDAELVKRMTRHPELRRRMESLLLTVEDEAGELKLADDAELRIIEEMRRTGRAALQEWADAQVQKVSQEFRQNNHVHGDGKKNCAGTVR